MIKSVNVTFDFDTENSVVTNVKCVVDGMQKKTRTTKKKSDVVEEMANESLITLETGKLVFNNKAVEEMELSPEYRIVIKYDQSKGKNKTLIPMIEVSDDEGVGNKISKTFTVPYKGKQNAVLAEFGSEFTIESTKDVGVWRLISKNNANTAKSLEETIEIVEKEEPDFIIDGDENVEIDEMMFNL